MGNTVAIIPCTNQKSDIAGPAREVWQGTHFQLTLAHAEVFYDKVYVMSYKYGMIEPDFAIEPYDLNIKYANAKQKLEWWWKVREDIAKIAKEDGPDLIAVYTGNFERDRLVREFARNGIRNVIIPWEEKTIGQRMQAVYDGEPPFDYEALVAGEYALPEGFGEPKKRGRPAKDKKEEVAFDWEEE